MLTQQQSRSKVISVNRCHQHVTAPPVQLPGRPSSWHSCYGSAWGNVIRLRCVSIEISALTLRHACAPSDSCLSSWDVEKCDCVRRDVDTRRINVLSNSRRRSQPCHVSFSSTLQHEFARSWRETVGWRRVHTDFLCLFLHVPTRMMTEMLSFLCFG